MARFWRSARPAGAPEPTDDDTLDFASGSDTLRLQTQVRARAKSHTIDRSLRAPRAPSATLLILGALRRCGPD